MCSRDKKLLKKALNGDIFAFEEIVSSNNKRIYNLCFRMMRNDQDAQDMAQEALIKAWRYLSKFNQKSSFSTWLHRIAVNTCLDEIRKHKNNTDSISTLQEKGIEIKDKSNDNIAEKFAIKQDIMSAMDKMDDKGKLIIVLKDVQGYSYEEIATIIKCPIGTVRSRLSRARKKLGEIYKSMELNQREIRQRLHMEAKYK